MNASAEGGETVRPRIVIVGSGVSGLALASMLTEANADTLVLEQVMPPGRDRGFAGIVSAGDLYALGKSLDNARALPVTAIAEARLATSDIGPDRISPVWSAVEHADLLRVIGRRLSDAGVALMPGATVTEFLWKQGCIAGVRCGESGLELHAELVILADESDPRLAEQVGLRPDWLPTELMHVAKVRYPLPVTVVRERFAAAGDGCRVVVFRHAASWGSPGYGIVLPGSESITVVVAMLLEDEMATARHIREYLDEVLACPVIRRLTSESIEEGFFTEVVPIGGFDAKPWFHTDGLLVVSDLVGVTNPLNRDGLSSNLAVCHAAARTIEAAIGANSFSSSRLAGYSRQIATEVIGPVNAVRRDDSTRRRRPPWQWASKPELVPMSAGLTNARKSGTLPAADDSSVWQRLRKFGRTAGVKRHAPGEYDE